MVRETVFRPAKIKVVGCGGGGCNAITRMVREGIEGVEFIAINTDSQALESTQADIKLQVGERVTRGLGVGDDHNLGRKAAEETQDQIRELVAGSDMVFVAAGMGGGTGTGAAPLVAQMAKDTGALTIAVVTKPFGFEGARRMSVAEEGIALLSEHVDTLIVIPNDKLLEVCDMKTVVDSAFKMADDVIMSGVRAITEVITVPGLINFDFADVKAVMKDGGQAWLSIGKGTGPNRAAEAAKAALHSQLLEVSVKDAKGALFIVTGGPSLTIHEVNEVAKVIQSEVHSEANIIFGVVFDPRLENEVHVTLVATGFRRSYVPLDRTYVHLSRDDIERLLGRAGEEEVGIPTFVRSMNRLSAAPAVIVRRQPGWRLGSPASPSREQPSGHSRPDERGDEKRAASSFEEDVQYYRANLTSFLGKYRGKYVAILDKRVVDSDADFARLAGRVYDKFGYRDIFMPKVEEPRVLSMPSPRIAGRR